MAQMGADIHGGIPPKDLFLSAYICVISGHSSHAETLVRSEKACVGEGESPSSLEARLPEFGTKVMNGKV